MKPPGWRLFCEKLIMFHCKRTFPMECEAVNPSKEILYDLQDTAEICRISSRGIFNWSF